MLAGSSNQVASYVGLIPREHSSGGKQRLGAIGKQGNRFMRQLLVESVQTVNRLDEGFRKEYAARCHHKPKGVAKVAAARKLAVRLYSTPATKTCRWGPRLDVAAERWLSGDRPYREQPAGGPERRKPSRDRE
jgi:hypothetical protein